MDRYPNYGHYVLQQAKLSGVVGDTAKASSELQACMPHKFLGVNFRACIRNSNLHACMLQIELGPS